jgi:hypothetical protein
VRAWRRSEVVPIRRSTPPPPRRRCCGRGPDQADRHRCQRGLRADRFEPASRSEQRWTDPCTISRIVLSVACAWARNADILAGRAAGVSQSCSARDTRVSMTPARSGHRDEGRRPRVDAPARHRRAAPAEAAALRPPAARREPPQAPAQVGYRRDALASLSAAASRPRRLIAVKRLVHIKADNPSEYRSGRYDSRATDRRGYSEQNIDDLLDARPAAKADSTTDW